MLSANFYQIIGSVKNGTFKREYLKTETKISFKVSQIEKCRTLGDVRLPLRNLDAGSVLQQCVCVCVAIPSKA